MMFKNKKFGTLTLAMAAIVALPGAAYAIGVAMHATATFYAALTLTATDLAFSTVDYTAAPSVLADFVKVGTNNAPSYGGVLSAHTGAATAAGTVTVNTGTSGQTVLVTCNATGIMKDAATSTYNVIGAEIILSGSGVAFGSANHCNGVGVATTPATTRVLSGTIADKFLVGAQFDGSSHAGSAFIGGVYSTASGTDLNVQVVYQ